MKSATIVTILFVAVLAAGKVIPLFRHLRHALFQGIVQSHRRSSFLYHVFQSIRMCNHKRKGKKRKSKFATHKKKARDASIITNSFLQFAFSIRIALIAPKPDRREAYVHIKYKCC